MTRLNVDLTEEQHQLIRDMARERGLSIKDFIIAEIVPTRTELVRAFHKWLRKSILS